MQIIAVAAVSGSERSMPMMTVRATNATFESVSHADYGTVDDAYRAAVDAGLGIAVQEVSAGAQSSIVHLSVDVVGRSQVMRGAVAVATGRLLDAAEPAA